MIIFIKLPGQFQKHTYYLTNYTYAKGLSSIVDFFRTINLHLDLKSLSYFVIRPFFDELINKVINYSLKKCLKQKSLNAQSPRQLVF